MRPDAFPKQPTEDETDAGFRVWKIKTRKSLHARMMGVPDAEVVAYQLSDSDLIIRVKDSEDGRARYLRYRWGRSQLLGNYAGEFPGWHSCDTEVFSEPVEAIQGFLFDKKHEGMTRIIPEPFQIFE